MFQWKVDRYSYYNMIQVNFHQFIVRCGKFVLNQDLVCDLGTFIFVPIFHHFNVNDNIIIMLACFSSVSSRLVRAFAKTELVFFSSTLCGIWLYISSAPIRSDV